MSLPVSCQFPALTLNVPVLTNGNPPSLCVAVDPASLLNAPALLQLLLVSDVP